MQNYKRAGHPFVLVLRSLRLSGVRAREVYAARARGPGGLHEACLRVDNAGRVAMDMLTYVWMLFECYGCWSHRKDACPWASYLFESTCRLFIHFLRITRL